MKRSLEDMEVSTREESSDLSCESGDVVANIGRTLSASSFLLKPRPSCDMSDYDDDEQQGVVTRAKVRILH
jgi:hypothetical protein